MNGVGLLHFDDLGRLLHRVCHLLWDDHRFHHSGSRHVHMDILWWAGHVVRMVDGVDNRSMCGHRLGNRHLHMLHFGDGVVDVLVHNLFRTELATILVATPALVST